MKKFFARLELLNVMFFATGVCLAIGLFVYLLIM